MKFDWKIGVSTCGNGDFGKHTFVSYAENGIPYMEISLPETMYPSLDLERIAEYSRETGVCVRSIHLPFYPFETNNIASTDSAVRSASVLMHSEYIKRAGHAGIKIAVIHPSGEPNPENRRDEMLACAGESLAKLALVAYRAGVTLAVEDLPRSCIGNTISDIQRLLSYDGSLGVCFDTNHLLTDDNILFVEALGKRIVTVHVSDYDFADEKHWLPYEGKNDWNGILKALSACGYDGPFMYEVPLTPARALDRGAITLADIVSNCNLVRERFESFEG